MGWEGRAAKLTVTPVTQETEPDVQAMAYVVRSEATLTTRPAQASSLAAGKKSFWTVDWARVVVVKARRETRTLVWECMLDVGLLALRMIVCVTERNE